MRGKDQVVVWISTAHARIGSASAGWVPQSCAPPLIGSAQCCPKPMTRSPARVCAVRLAPHHVQGAVRGLTMPCGACKGCAATAVALWACIAGNFQHIIAFNHDCSWL